MKKLTCENLIKDKKEVVDFVEDKEELENFDILVDKIVEEMTGRKKEESYTDLTIEGRKKQLKIDLKNYKFKKIEV